MQHSQERVRQLPDQVERLSKGVFDLDTARLVTLANPLRPLAASALLKHAEAKCFELMIAKVKSIAP